MKSFRELRVWQAAMNLVEKAYRLTRDLYASEVSSAGSTQGNLE
jgi:hypothetical protein